MTTEAIALEGQRESGAERRVVGAAWLPIITVAVVFAVAAWGIPPYAVGIFHDDGVYVILAKSIASGHGFHYLHLPGMPAATHYPPLYPLLLALLWRVQPDFPQNIGFLLLTQAALLAVTAWGAQRFLNRRLGWTPGAATALALVGVLSLPLMTLGSALLSEVLFAALLFPVLLVAESMVDSDSIARALGIGAAAGTLALVRTHALALAAAVLVILVLRRRWKPAAAFAAAVIAVMLPWQIWTSAQPALPVGLRGSYGSYLGWYAGGIEGGGPAFVAATVWVNLKEVSALLADRFSPLSFPTMRFVAAVIAASAAAVGGVRLWKRVPVTIAFCALYVAVMVLWPYAPWRFLFAIWPLVLVLMVAGGAELMRRANAAGSALPRFGVAATGLVIVAGAVRAEATAYARRGWAEPARNAIVTIAPMVRWVDANTHPGDLLLADDEPLVYLFTGHQAMPPRMFTAREYVTPQSPDQAAAAFRELLATYPVRYVVSVDPGNILLARGTRGDRPGVREVGRFETGVAFEVQRP